jgi:hypothetical protein
MSGPRLGVLSKNRGSGGSIVHLRTVYYRYSKCVISLCFVPAVSDSRLPLTFFAPSNTAIHFALQADAMDPFVSNGAFRDLAILKHITEALTFEDLEDPRNVTSLGGHVIKFTRHSRELQISQIVP